MAADLNILGKDYLTREEAAFYACMSPRHWDEMRKLHGIVGIPWAGKIVYRKSDIQRAIEQAWQQSADVANLGFSNGERTGGVSARASAQRRSARPSSC